VGKLMTFEEIHGYLMDFRASRLFNNPSNSINFSLDDEKKITILKMDCEGMHTTAVILNY
jgi:hypothetical protein